MSAGNSAGSSGRHSTCNSGGISASDSKGMLAGHRVGISIVFLHSKNVQFSLIAAYPNLNVFAPEHLVDLGHSRIRA